jgi:hypothetical protein
VFGVIAAVECFISEFPLSFDLVEEECDQLGGPVGEAGSVDVAAATAPGTVSIIHSLEVSGDLAGAHAAPADIVLIGERFSKDSVRTESIVPGDWALVFGVAVPACRGVLALTRWSLRSSIWEEWRSTRRGSRHRMTWSQVLFLPKQVGQESGSSGLMRCRIRPTGSQP